MPSWKNAGWRRAGHGAGKIGRALAATRRLFGRFSADRSGNVFVIFGLSATVLVIAVGAGVDLANAYVARQKLSNAATLTCQFANRNTNLKMIDDASTGVSSYQAAVNTFFANSIAQQTFPTALTRDTSQGPAFIASGTSSVSAGGNLTTSFMQIIGKTTLPLSVTVTCGTPLTPPAKADSQTLVHETFEHVPTTAMPYVFILSNNQVGTTATPSSATPATASYYGANGSIWKTIGYCLEIDGLTLGHSATPDGTHSAELDCDNGSSNAGNSSISTLIPLQPGEYELRYLYESRIKYLNYAPTYICGSTAADVAWANDTRQHFGPFDGNYSARTNQINAYLDKDVNGTIPLHTTIDGTQQLGGTNLIDMCVDSYNWIERSVRITVTTAGNYWLSFAADGASDSFGGQLDNIRFCNNPCPNALQDNFPFSANQVLFEETFESPTIAKNCPNDGCNNINTTLNTFYGTTGTSNSGWPSESQRGWATAPYNQINMDFVGPVQGSQYIQVEGYQSSGQSTSNRTVSRYFYLDPGYYQISYYYVSDILFSLLPTVSCAYPPYTTATFQPAWPAQTNYGGGVDRLTGGNGTWILNSNELAVFMSNSQLVSYPNGGGVLNSVTSFTNPDASISTTAAVPPDSLNIYGYNASQPNALIDFCVSSPAWTQRTVPVMITKPGQYWLSFASMGSNDGLGAALDDVKLTALGSLYMASPPANAATIATAGPTPGSSISYTGFSFVADPLKPPAP